MQDANIHNYPIGVDHDYVPICSMLIFRGVVGIRLFGTFWQLASLWNGRDLATKCSWLAGLVLKGKKHTRQAQSRRSGFSFYSFFYPLNAWKCHWVLINPCRWWLPVGQQKTSWNLGVEKVLGNYRNGSAMISAPVVEFRVRIQSIHPGKAQKKDKGTTILWATLNKVIAIYVGYSQLSTTCWFGV